jgi:hypothetical protein
MAVSSKSSWWIGLLGCALGFAFGACSNTGNDTPNGSGNAAVGGPGDAAGIAGTGAGGSTPTGGTGASTPTDGADGSTPAGGTGGSTAPVPVDCTTAGAALPDGECKEKAEGIYAVRTTLDVWWHDERNAAAPIADPGRDKIVIYMMADLKDVCGDGHGTGVIRACGSELPAFTSDIACDAYQLEFDDAIWDHPYMPTFTTGRSSDGFDVGSTLNVAQVVALIGIRIDGETFPTSADTGSFACDNGMHMGLDCFPDQDGDTELGISVKLKRGGVLKMGCGGDANTPYTYRGAPTTLDPLVAGGSGSGIRAVEAHIGLSTTLGGSATIAEGCESGAGVATAPEIAIKSRVATCKVDPASLPAGDTMHANNACTGMEATFLDVNVPSYHVLQANETPPASGLHWPLGLAGQTLDPTPSPGPLNSMVRLGDRGMPFTCADVRAAQFPAN